MDQKKEIKKIIERNKRVEADKAWETSLTRRLIISVMTYLLIVLFLWVNKMPNPWLNALIPAIAFILSTLTLPFFKRWWLKQRRD
ncbi:hypothetical protein KY366_03240 [Candidatus Woesearchaeota archaeon]|nr:hypothetical protein [Candidatus Woesearchaeota archaeon]